MRTRVTLPIVAGVFLLVSVAPAMAHSLIAQFSLDSFTSVADLARKIRRYIRHYNKAAKPIRWSYRNTMHRK